MLVQDSPDSVESLKLIKLSSRAFQVSWSSPFDGNSPIKRYLLQYKTSLGTCNFKREFFLNEMKLNFFYVSFEKIIGNLAQKRLV